MKDEIIRKQEELIAIKRISAGVYLKFNNELNLSLDDCENITEFIIQGYDDIFLKLAELKEQDQQPEQSAEEILENNGILVNVDGNEYLKYGITLNKIRKAMQEYRQQGMPTEEEIWDWIEKEMPIDDTDEEVNRYCRKAVRLFGQWLLNKWKGE